MSITDFIHKLKNKENNENINLLKIPRREVYAPKITQNITTPNIIHQADLLFLPMDNKFKYALVVVDVYNKKCDAEPIMNKTSASVVKGFIKIYKRKILELPHVIQFDNGSEFKGDVKLHFQKETIKIKYGLTNRHRQNASVEAKNRLLGSIIMKY